MMNKRPLLLLLFVALIPAFAFAQDGQNAADNSLLPEINPQDIEIRSEFQARFPGLRRQPILGFNPRPRVFQIDPNRMPFMESRDDAVADISVTQLGRPEPPMRTLLSSPDRQNAYFRAGFGSYLTPEVNGYGFYEINDRNALSANVNFNASDGHLENQDSDFRFFDVSTKYVQQTADKWRLIVDAGALADKHHLFNVEGIQGTPEKENLGASGKITIRQTQNSFRGFEGHIGGSIFETTVSSHGKLSEKTYFGGVKTYWPGKRMYEVFDISASIAGGAYEDFAPSDNWVLGDLGITYERLFNFTTRIRATAGGAYISDSFSETFYVAPELEIKHHLSDRLSITGAAFAKPEMKTVQQHHQYNRMLNTRTNLRHSYNIGFSSEANYQLFEGNRIFSGVSYAHVKDYSYYQREADFIISSGSQSLAFYNTNYGDANIFEFYAGASQQLVPEKFWADAKVYIRSPKLTSGGTVPYEEKLGMEAAVSFKPIRNLKLNGWAEYIGSRPSPETNSDLNAFLLLNAGTEYQINETFGIYAKLLNILDSDYEIWDGYEERPLQILGGITIKF